MWLIVDKNFEICNDAAVRVLGYSTQSELQSTHPSQLSPEYQDDGQSSFDKAEEMMATALSQGYNRFEWIHTRKNGEDFPVEVTLTKIPFQGKDCIYCVWRDITERKKLESELTEAKQIAEEANNSKSRFLSMMSHELRTPLNAVLGFSEMLTSEINGPLNDKQMSTANSIHNGGELLLHLVEDLLSMAQIEQGELRLNPEACRPSDIQTNVINLVKALAEETTVNLHISDIPLDIDCIYADSIRAEQILLNLLTNAIKYNYPGGNVWISLEHNGNNVRFIVKDDGFGISKEHIANVFDPFNRGDQATSGIEGTGLGLPICKKLAMAMNGHCDFKSTRGQGSTFWLDLPKCAD